MLEAILTELSGKFLVYFNREAVRSQFQAVIIAVIAAIIIARVVIFLANRLASRLEDRPDKWVSYAKHVLSFVRWLVFPIAGLIILEVTLVTFTGRNDLAGVIEKGIYIFTLIFVYRLALALMYLIFGQQSMRRFHMRLIGPLFTLFVLYEILSDFVRFPTLAQITLVDRVEDPLTIGTLFLVLVGLYFWIDSVAGLGEIIRGVTARYTKIPPSKIEGSLTLARYLLITIGLYLGLTSLGIDSTTVAAVTAGLSVGLGFGMKEVITSFISGIILLLEGSIRPGDLLLIDNRKMVVEKLGIRSTVVRTPDKMEIIIPNEKLFTAPVTNITGSNNIVRIHIPVRAGFQHDPEDVIKLLEDTAHQHPKVQSHRRPMATLQNFGEFSIEYDLRVWFDARSIGFGKLKSEIRRQISKVFAEHNIEIPFPQRQLHLHDGRDKSILDNHPDLDDILPE